MSNWEFTNPFVTKKAESDTPNGEGKTIVTGPPPGMPDWMHDKARHMLGICPGTRETQRDASSSLSDLSGAWEATNAKEDGALTPVPSYPFIILTNSSMRVMRSCMRKWQLKYVERLGRIDTGEESEALFFGDIVHQALEEYFKFTMNASDNASRYWILDRFLSQRCEGEMLMKARAMMDGYIRKWKGDPDKYEPIDTELQFSGNIHNPDTNGISRTFKFAGRVDAVVQDAKGNYWIIEHKTAAYVDGAYLERLWTDSQIALYTMYLREQGIPIKGVIYDILTKCKYSQKAGETEAEYKIRHADLCAKNKSGKSSAKRQMPETDQEYFARLLQFHSQPEVYHRETILIDDARIELAKNELWDATKRYLDAKSRNYYGINADACFNYGRRCTYFDYCSSGNSNVLDLHFEQVQPHSELDLISLFGHGNTGDQHATTDETDEAKGGSGFEVDSDLRSTENREEHPSE